MPQPKTNPHQYVQEVEGIAPWQPTKKGKGRGDGTWPTKKPTTWGGFDATKPAAAAIALEDIDRSGQMCWGWVAGTCTAKICPNGRAHKWIAGQERKQGAKAKGKAAKAAAKAAPAGQTPPNPESNRQKKLALKGKGGGKAKNSGKPHW